MLKLLFLNNVMELATIWSSISQFDAITTGSLFVGKLEQTQLAEFDQFVFSFPSKTLTPMKVLNLFQFVFAV
jgi:hypothetical protein